MDDEEVMQAAIESMLKTFGYSVICKNNGKETLEYFYEKSKEKSLLSGLILDLTIPGGMGGKDVIEKIRKLDPDIPVFVASGYSDDPVMKNPGMYGFTGSISKPFTRGELADLLERHIKKF